mgnify:CR=1 FL=1
MSIISHLIDSNNGEIVIEGKSLDQWNSRDLAKKISTLNQSNHINIRLKNAFEELKFVEEYDYFVINDKVKNAVESVESIIKAEKLKVKRYNNIIEKIMD